MTSAGADIPRMTIAALKGFRKRHSATQEQLADWLGVSLSSVSHWETDRPIPKWVQKRCEAADAAQVETPE